MPGPELLRRVLIYRTCPCAFTSFTPPLPSPRPHVLSRALHLATSLPAMPTLVCIWVPGPLVPGPPVTCFPLFLRPQFGCCSNTPFTDVNLCPYGHITSPPPLCDSFVSSSPSPNPFMLATGLSTIPCVTLSVLWLLFFTLLPASVLPRPWYPTVVSIFPPASWSMQTLLQPRSTPVFPVFCLLPLPLALLSSPAHSCPLLFAVSFPVITVFLSAPTSLSVSHSPEVPLPSTSSSLELALPTAIRFRGE